MSKQERLPYGAEPGRHYALEYPLFAKPAEVLAKKGVPADVVTLFGAVAGVTGSYLVMYPGQVREKIVEFSSGRITPSINQVRAAGTIVLGISYTCDLLDGAMAAKSVGGETKHGRVLDGIINKIVDIAPAVFELEKARSGDTKLTWFSYQVLAPVSTIVRSIGLRHDVEIAKTGLNARVGRLPLLIASMMCESKRNLLGKLLIGQILADTIQRYNQIARAGNEDALEEVHRELLKYFTAVLLAKVSGANNFSVLTEEIVALADTITDEAYRD